VEVACTDAVGDDGAHRPFVLPLSLACPGPGRLGQARGVPVGDQRLAAMGGMPQGVDPDGPAQPLHWVAHIIDGSPEVVQDAVDSGSGAGAGARSITIRDHMGPERTGSGSFGGLATTIAFSSGSPASCPHAAHRQA
jgi:hypothetical protein